MALAKYAVSEHNSKGRLYPEPSPIDRDAFQRDRDRIIHSAAFRRLEYKTQVFVNHEGDLYRTRLTHSIEVAQIARSVACNLKLNEALTEALALAHDLGHTPFGHAGQTALNRCMRAFGGFEHNLQSLRVVDKLEERYAAFPGLNLCFETREGILKHCSIAHAKELGEIGLRFLHNTQASLEAQLVDIADALAYNNHDVDDGLRSGLLEIEQMLEHPLFAEHFTANKQRWPKASERILVHETIRNMIHHQIQDLLQHSKKAIANVHSVAQVRGAAKPLIGFSAPMRESHLALKRLLRKSLYQHPKILAMTEQAQEIVTDLFQYFMAHPEMVPHLHYHTPIETEAQQARVCADYIAGMTDRFARKTWLKREK